MNRLQTFEPLASDGLTPRVKYGTGKHAEKLTWRERMQYFVHKYAGDNTLPLQGRLQNSKTFTPCFLLHIRHFILIFLSYTKH